MKTWAGRGLVYGLPPGRNLPGYHPKISSKTAFSQTLTLSTFPPKNSLVALKVDVVESG
jgi:hypothetical protein